MIVSVGNRIKERRKELKMSAETLADIIGVSAATIYRYENGGIANMGTDKLENIAQALNIEPKYLMGWAQEANQDCKKHDQVDEICEAIRNNPALLKLFSITRNAPPATVDRIVKVSQILCEED